MEPEMGRMTKRKIATYFSTLFLAAAFTVASYLYAPPWVIAAAAIVLATTLFPIVFDYSRTPKPFRAMANEIRAAHARSATHPILLKFYNDGINRTQRVLEDVIKGRFQFQVSELPDMSAHAVSLIDERCTLIGLHPVPQTPS
jgi:hypothetical protein